MFRMLKMLVSVPIVMACATAGTVGLIKAAESGQGEHGMPRDTTRDQMRRGIVEKSVQILRSHGKSDEEIRSMILNDFHIEEKVLDEILNADMK